jgi:polysaccharide pyruvyl transferase WcaK-like protein
VVESASAIVGTLTDSTASAARPSAAFPPGVSIGGRSLRIGLLGPYSSRNLGDTATQLTVMHQLRARLGAVSFVGIAPEPDNTLSSLGISAFPLYDDGAAAGTLPVGVHASAWPRWRAMLQLVGQLDLLVVSGGGQLDDFWGGPWSHPWAMLLWTSCSRLRNVPVCYLGVGVDHLHHPLSRRFSVLALRLAQHRSFRETDSRTLLQSLGLKAASEVCPDLVFALEPSLKGDAAAPFAVISPISRKTWSKSPTAVHDNYMTCLIAAGQALAAQGLHLRIAVTQPAMDSADAIALATALRHRGVNGVTVAPIATVDDFLRAVHGARLVVASRLHAVILALIVGCPVVALAHLPKVERVMRDADIGDYCLPLQYAVADRLTELVLKAEAAAPILRERVQSATRRFSAQLGATFDALAELAVKRGVR